MGGENGPWGTEPGFVLRNGHHVPFALLEAGRGLVLWLVRSFSASAGGWTADMDKRQSKQIVQFELFVEVRHLTEIVEQQVGTRTMCPPFTSGESPAIVSVVKPIGRQQHVYVVGVMGVIVLYQ